MTSLLRLQVSGSPEVEMMKSCSQLDYYDRWRVFISVFAFSVWNICKILKSWRFHSLLFVIILVIFGLFFYCVPVWSVSLESAACWICAFFPLCESSDQLVYPHVKLARHWHPALPRTDAIYLARSELRFPSSLGLCCESAAAPLHADLFSDKQPHVRIATVRSHFEINANGRAGEWTDICLRMTAASLRAEISFVWHKTSRFKRVWRKTRLYSDVYPHTWPAEGANYCAESFQGRNFLFFLLPDCPGKGQ